MNPTEPMPFAAVGPEPELPPTSGAPLSEYRRIPPADRQRRTDQAPCDYPNMTELRVALAVRNGLARQTADLTDRVNDLAAQVDRLTPLAAAARQYVATIQAAQALEADWEDVNQAWQVLQDAATAWWDQ